MSEPAKTVAIIGGGPVGLAAAAHALERGLRAGRAGGRRAGGPCRAAMVACAHVLALVLQRRQGGGTTVARRRAGMQPGAASSIRPAASLSSTTSSRWRRAPRSRSTSRPTRAWSRVARVGFDKVKTSGREKAPFEIRYQNGKAPADAARRCRDRCLRNLELAQSGRRQRTRGHRRGRARRAHRLWHARCPRRRARPLCRQGQWRCSAPAIRPSAPSSTWRS